MAHDIVDDLYDNLKEDGWIENGREDFRAFFFAPGEQGYKNRKALYDNLKDDGYVDSPTYEVFARRLGLQAAAPKQTDKPAPTQRSQQVASTTKPKESEEPAYTFGDRTLNAGDVPDFNDWKPKQADIEVPLKPQKPEKPEDNGTEGVPQYATPEEALAAFKEQSQKIVGDTQRMFDANKPENRAKIQALKMAGQIQGRKTDLPGLTVMPSQGEGGIGLGTQRKSLEGPKYYGTTTDAEGKSVDQWLMPDGSVTTDFFEADAAEAVARQSRLQREFTRRMEQNGLDVSKPEDVEVQKAYDRLEEINKEYALEEDERLKRLNEYLQSPSQQLAARGNSMISGVMMPIANPETQISEDEISRHAEKRALEQAIMRYNAGKLKKTGSFFATQNIVNAAHGVKDVVTDIDTYAAGMESLTSARVILGIKAKLDKGEQLTRREQSLMESMLIQQTINEQADVPHGYTMGYTIANMVPFMVQMYLNPTSAAGTKAGQLAVKTFAKTMAKQAGQRAAKNFVVKAATKLGKKRAAAIAKAIGVTAGDITSSMVLANTFQAPSTMADASLRHVGEVAFDEDGNLHFVNGEGVITAFAKAEAAAGIENYTEMLGAHFGLIGATLGRGASKVARKLGGGKMLDQATRLITNIKASDFAKGVAAIESRAEWHGSFGEMLEEEAGIVLNSIITGDNKLSDLVDKEQQIDIALGVGVFGAFVSGIKTVGYPIGRYKARHRLEGETAECATLFGDEWASLQATIDNADEKDLSHVLCQLTATGQSMTIKKANALIKYASALTRARSYNLAAASVAAEAGAPDQQQVEQSYDNGYNAEGAEMADAKNLFDATRQKAEETLDAEIIEQIDSNPVAALMEMRRNGLYSEDEIASALDYANAKAAYDGMQQRINDDIDTEIAQSDDMISARTNNTSAMIHPAIAGLDNRKVYIVGGLVVTNAEGTIDRDASDESLIIRDAATGELTFVDPKEINSVEEAIDPEVERAEAIDAIRQKGLEAATNTMNGTLAFNPGDVVQINDGGGLVQVTVLGPIVDEESGMPIEGQVMVQFPNGQQTPFTKEQLQAFADAAMRERLDSYEAEKAAALANQKGVGTGIQKPQFALNDEFTILNDAGEPVRGSITGELDEDGTVEIYTEEPVNGNRVNRFTPAELEEMFDTYNGEPVATTVAAPEAEAPQQPIADTKEYDRGFEDGIEVSKSLSDDVLNEAITDLRGREFLTDEWRGRLEAYEYEQQRRQMEAQNAPAEAAGNNDTENIPQNGNIAPENIPQTENPAPNAQPEQPQSALSRIPLDEKGKPNFEAADVETAWDAIVEKTSNEKIAQSFADNMVANAEAALKKAEKTKTKSSTDIDEFMEAENERLAAIERAKVALEHWKAIAGTAERRRAERRAAEDAEARRRAQERAEEEARLKAEREEAERIEREALNGVPDWNIDTPADARARGYRRNGPQKVDRPEIIDNHTLGNSVEVKFGDDVMPKGNIAVIEASQLQPSHRDGQRNPYHFLDEAQPKERKDAVSRFAAAKIAETMRPEEITSSVTAYTGAPSINSRGEVIQGNNRSEALRIMYERYSQSADKYKQYLIDHAAEFGLTPEAIAAFEQPVLVNMLDVSDEDAITLGQYVAQDTESGGIERIKPKNAVQKMGDKIRTFANLLLRSADDEATFAQLVDANGVEVLKWMNQQGFITNTQYASAFDSRGNLTAEAANDLKGIMYQSIFTGGSTRLEEMFNKMPAKAQRAILATAFRDHDSAFADRMISEIQQSIIAFNALMNFKQFRDASNAKDTQNAVEAWEKQYAFDDVSGEPYLPSETFSNFALALAAMYKGHTQRHIQSVFNMMYDIVQGTEQDNLFEAADKTPKPLAEAIRRVLNLEYQPITKPTTDNGSNGSAVLDVNSEDGQDGRPGSDGNADGAEQSQEEAEPSDGGTGTASDSGQGGELVSQSKLFNYFAGSIKDLIELAKGTATGLFKKIVAPISERLQQDLASYGIEISTEYKHVIDNNAIRHTLKNHGGQQEEKRGQIPLTDSDFERIEDVVSNYDDISVEKGKRNNFNILYSKKYDDGTTIFVEEKRDGRKELAAITMWKKKNSTLTDANRNTTPISDLSEVSDRKVNNSVSEKQEVGSKSSLGERVKAAEAEHTEPTGDYTIDTYTTKKGKTYHRVVFPRADKAVWQERLNLAKKMGGTSVPIGYGFKTREEAEAFAKAVANPETVADAQPLSLEDMRPTTGIAQVDVDGLMTQLSQTGEANLADYSTPVNAEEAKPTSDKPVNPSGNKLVTDERYAELRELMRKKLGGQLNMGIDPEILAIGTEMAVYHIEKGARKFKAYASAMIADLGDAIRPYLKSFYNAVRDMPEAEAAGLVADMDSYDEVRSVDIANFDKLSIDALATAAAVVAEQKAENEKAEAERKLQAYRHLVNKYAQDIANSPMFKKAVSKNGSKSVKSIGIDLYKYYVGEDIITIAENSLYQMFTDQWNADDGVLQSAILAEAIRKAHKAIQQDNAVVNPDVTTTETVVEGGNEAAPSITVPEPRPAADLSGDSAVYQDRTKQTAELVGEIGSAISSRVALLTVRPDDAKPLTMTEVKKLAAKYPALKDISDTDLQELVELAMTQLTRTVAISGVKGTADQQKSAYDRIVDLYKMQPSLNARDSERLIKQQYSTPTPFGFVMGQFVRAGGKEVGSMLEPSAGNGALTITVHPSVIHVNDIDDARLANLRKLGYGQVTAQDALLPFSGDKVDVVMTNPPFGTVTEKVYDGVFRISSLEGQMAINALEQMKDDGRAAIVIGGNTSYRTNGSMNPKDAAFFGYLYSHYNVADVINISGKALYSRNGTGYDVRMILIDGRKTGEFQRVFPPVKTKARAEQITTFDELYKRVQDDIQQIQQVGSQSANVQRDTETAANGTESAPVRTGSNRPNTGAGQRPGKTGDAVRSTSRPNSGQPTPANDGGRPVGVDNAESGNAGSTDNVPRPAPQQPRSVGSGSSQNGTGRSGSDGRGAATSRPDRGAERLEVKPDLTTEKVPYPNQSGNGFTLMSVVPAAQAQVLQKSLGEIGDVDQYLVDELGYSSKEELYSYLAAEQIDSVALAIHQMNKGNAFIVGDMTGVGKGRQGAALIRYAVMQGKVPIYFTQKPTLYTDNYRDLCDIGSSNLRPFIIASNAKDANIVDADGNVVHKLPSKKEQERVFNYIMEHGTLPDEYDYVLTTYDQIKNGTADYEQNEDGTWNTVARKLPKKSKGYTTADANGQTRRDALARLAEGNITILDESHTVGGDSGCGRYMQMLTSQAGGVTFLSATFAKRADNMPIYAQRTAIAEAGVKASELIDAIMKGGVTLQEITSKQLVESGQMIRRERSFEGVTIDWLSVAEETDRRQRQQFNEVAEIFNAIRNFQDDYITPIIDAKNEEAAEHGATVGHTQGTKDMGVKNVPFASKMYNLINQLLFALKVDAVADRVVENLRNGYKPVISFTNTMEGFLSSAPKGVAMDDVPNFSLTLMRALDGVMRFTEKDADENSEGGSISLSELSTEGQNAYNAIREKIMNLSTDLPISPMDAIRMKIENAGYSVAEITGRTMQLNRTDDGRYIVEARKDRDKKAAMRDFNSGKLDVLMINKSGSTGISLHASSKFEDQRPRVMVFAQFQSDINDEVQMRGRIDRSGQVTRGRYEYIMSTIPAEQRIQMMFKAKLKSLDANTTSSQKSKFNEMEIVDYLNKYGDEVVWEYMKEHPELEERLGDPLDMLQEKKDDDGPRTSEKEDTSKKTGCAGKISRYLAFLSVEEQDEIFREITEAYRVKIQLLDDAGENDLEITTMPLRAETKRKQIWHEGENPGSGNAFADNTYVEEVEVDVLKKPMKRAEVEEATRKLVGEKGLATEYDQQRYGFKEGEVNWNRYVETMQSEIDQFFQTKADEAVAKLKEAGDARVAKAREKAVSAATKARSRGENNFSDEEIQSLADTVANEAREKETYKQRKRREEIMAVRDRIKSLFTNLRAGGIYVVPQDLKQATPEMFSQTFGTFVGFKFNKSYTLGSSTAIFATLDGRRKVELALSDPGLQTIIGATNIAYRYSPKEINAINMENWDSNVPTQTRQKRYIITGNLLQALVDTEKGERTRGNLISYSTIDGETRQGILMGENFKLTDLRNSAPLSSRLAQIREGKAIVSENGDVQIKRELYDWRHRGEYELRVPKSKQRGGIYTMHPDLLKLVSGYNFITKGNNMVAYVAEDDIAKVVDMLSRAPFNLTVLQESKLADVSADEAEDDVLCRPVTDKATLDRLNNEPTIKVYRAMQMIDGGLRPPMSGKVDGQWRDATEVGVWEEAEEHPEMADENGRFKLDKGNGKSIKAAYNPYIHTSRSPINDQFSSAWSRPELVTVEVEVPASELTSEYHAENAKDSVGEKEWKSGPVGRALAKIGQARKVILSRWSRIIRVVPVEEVAEAYAQRLNAHGIEVPFNTVPPALREALAERGVKIGKPEKGNAGDASMPAFEQWIMEQERQRMGDGYGAYSDEEVSFANDPVSKVMGKNRFSKKRQAEFAARERQRMVARIQELAERMHLDNVEILTDATQLEGKRAKAKGFYNKRTGKITIVIPNNVSTIDAEQTLLHEAVAHFGLRKLFGKQFDTFLDNVYQSADESIRRKIAEMAAKNGWDFRTATEEYLAGLAETFDFENALQNAGWWATIKRLFLDMLESIGFEGFRDKTGVVLTDNELRYLLWRSYENLTEPGASRSILGEAADVAKQAELKVGNYAERGIEAEYAAEPYSSTKIEEVNNRFNAELRQQINQTLPAGHIYQLGRPGKILRSTGIPDLPIQMSASRLKSKATEYGHDFDISEIKNLVKELQEPIAVFAYGNKGKMQNIVVGIESNGKQFIVGLSLNPVVNGKVLEINSIRNVFPKDNAEWLNWITQGKMLYADKEKIQALIDKQRTILADVDYLNLDDVTKIVKSFENPTIEEEELFRPGDFTPRDKAFARREYERIVSSGSYQFQEAVQDSMLGLKKLYQTILGKGTRIENVSGFENAYLFENRMSSMNGGEQHEYFIRYMQPLLKEIAQIAGADKRKRRELTDYLMAKHGLERNEYMRNEAAANGEETDRDFAGLIGLTGEADWQSAEATAQQWVDDYESAVDTTALWQAINNATKATLEKIYLSGIISKETYEKILGMYDYYVPLRGWNETTSEQVYGYLTSKDGPLGGSIMKKAEGRESMADDPIATIDMMADDAIRQGNRNLMKQCFLNFILNHPSDAVSVHDIWLEYNDVTDEWVPVFADVEDTDTADEVAQKVEAFEQRMEALRNAEPDKYKKGREAQHIPYKVVKGNLREHQILIKRNGRTFVATINGNPRAAQALNGLTNPDVDQNGVVGNMLEAGTWINRQLSAFYTTRNPDFVVSNFFRDMLYSNCMTWVKESPRYALAFHKNFGRVNPVVMRRLFGKWESGTLDMNNRLESLFYQFMRNGGETGYTNVRDIEGYKRAIAAELKKQGSVGRKAWAALGMQLDLLNRSAENCARFAAFITSRDFGRSIGRAIYDAKEISVNFNKKGSGAKMVNANGQTKLGKFGAYLSGTGRLLYIFWNTGVQAITNFGRQAKLHPIKSTAGASALLTLGYIIPMLAEMLGGGDGDDDDKNAYYNLPEYVRRSNICFRAGEQWITIPLPIEYRAIYGMGELAHGVISGNERYTNAELGRQMAAQVSQIMPLDMLEGGGGISPFIPSAAKPFTEAYIMNKSWTGLPVYKDTPFNKNDPEWTKAYASADKHLVAFAKWLNETSGGDDFKKGSIDINPAKIEYLLNGTFGGMFTFPNKIKKTGETMFGDRNFEWRNMPIANRLIKSGDERTANRKLQNEYFNYKAEYEETGRLIRKYENADERGVMGYAEKVNFMQNSDEYLRWEIFDEFKPDIDSYRERIATESNRNERGKIEAQMYLRMRELVNALHDPKEHFKELYDAGMLDDEYATWLREHHGINLKESKR